MRTEDVLRRDAEYRAVREALGRYDVILALPRAGEQPHRSPPDPLPPGDHAGSNGSACSQVPRESQAGAPPHR